MLLDFRRAATMAVLLSLFALSAGAGTTLAADDPGLLPPQAGSHAHTDQRVCDAPAVGAAACHARIRTDPDAAASRPASGKRPPKARPDVLGNNGAYDPSYLQSAYQTPSGGGAGLTVAIVDAYDQPNAAADLATYRAYFGLPAIHGTSNTDGCTVAAGPFPCFQKVNQSGGSTPPAASGGWGQEISLDIDMVSAICPNCNILLVEASSNSFADLGTAVNTAVRMGAIVVSNSYGGGEFSSETSYDSSYFSHPGVAITASSGDAGYGVEYPAASQYVTAVGGTSLNQATNTGTRNATETVWSGAGSGCSAYEGKPSWQKDTGCARRTVSDVSAVADPNTGVWVYDSYMYQGRSGWLIFGGTSVSAPIVGAVYALGGRPGGSTYPSSYPYSAGASSLNDVTSGSNGGCGTYLCNGGPGYDGPSGLGTPNSTGAFVYAAPQAVPDFSVSVSPSSASATPGGSASYTVSLTAANGYASPVNLAVSGLPSGAGASFSTNPVTPASPGATSNLTIIVGSGTAPGTYNLTITGTGTDPANTTHTAAASLVVSVPDFSISATPSSQSVTAGGSASYTVSLTAKSGYSSTVSLSAGGLPAGASASFNPTSVNPSGSSTMTVSTSASTPAGSYSITITGTGSDASTTTHSTTVSLMVGGDFSLSASKATVTMSPGSSAADAISVSGSNGYTSTVTLSVSGLPQRTNANFSPNPVTPGGSSTMTINANRRATPGTYALTVTGKGADGTTHTIPVTLVIQ